MHITLMVWMVDEWIQATQKVEFICLLEYVSPTERY